MSKFIFFRHANKETKTNFSLDPPLTPQGKELARLRFEKTYSEVPEIPKVIYCSPYVRTIETAYVAQNVLFLKTGIKVPIIVISEISDYFNSRKYSNYRTLIQPKTLTNYKIPIEKHNREYSRRIRIFSEKLKELNNGYYWFITHGTFIQNLARLFGTEMEHPDFLDGFILEIGSIGIGVI